MALPAILTQEEQDDLRADVDRMEADRKLHQDQKTPAPFIVEYDKLGKLCSHPAIVDRVKELMKAYVTPDGSPGNAETNIAMHHIHASRQDEGTGGVHWHQGAISYHCTCALALLANMCCPTRLSLRNRLPRPRPAHGPRVLLL